MEGPSGGRAAWAGTPKSVPGLPRLMFGGKTTIGLKVSGMTCGNCVGHVTKALESVHGVKHATVSLQDGTASVLAKASTPVSDLVAAVEDAGYQAEAR